MIPRSIVGTALLTFSTVALGYAVYQLAQIGTCASGGPYVIAQECPEGTELLAVILPVGILAGFAGAFIHPSGRAFLWFWVGTFGGICVACFLAVWGPEADPTESGRAGALIVAITFVFMTLGGIAGLVMSYRGTGTSWIEQTRVARATMGPAATPDRSAAAVVLLNLLVVAAVGWGTYALMGSIAPDLPPIP